MAQRDRASMRVQLLAEGVDPDAARRRDDLGGEGLVDLDDVDVVDAHPGPLERLLRGVDRTQAHELGLERGQAGRDHARERLDPQLPGARF